MNWEKYIRQIVWLFRERPRLAWSIVITLVGMSGSLVLYRRRLAQLRSPIIFLLNGTLAPTSRIPVYLRPRSVASSTSASASVLRVSSSSSSSSSTSVTSANLNLRDMLLFTRQRAIDKQALSPLTTKEIIDLTEHSIPFRINVIDRTNQRKKGGNVTLSSSSSSSAATSTSSSSSSRSWPPSDAFATRDPDLHITDITVPKAYPTSLPHQGYSLLLNKYPVSLDHMVLITKEFVSQSTPLTIEDMAVWFKCIQEYQALGFFNGGFKSGASQPRKHMQLVPLRSISITSTVPYRTPFDTLLYSVLEKQTLPYTINPDQILTIPQFTFPHGVVMLGGDILRMAPMEAGKYLITLYLRLLNHCSMPRVYQTATDLASSVSPVAPSKDILTPEQDYTSHNVLLTKDYLFVVPRTIEAYPDSLSVNALAYAGYFLANKESNTVNVLRTAGSLQTLKVCAMGHT